MGLVEIVTQMNFSVSLRYPMYNPVTANYLSFIVDNKPDL